MRDGGNAGKVLQNDLTSQCSHYIGLLVIYLFQTSVCVHVCMCACVHVCRVHICACVCECVCLFACMHAHTHTCVNLRTGGG